uniref:ABC transmembrane type-1 domain-containing protein n=1 Tax=Lygus hesperus TaxID=30085 RepID=A0A0K8S5R1_LYGHE
MAEETLQQFCGSEFWNSNLTWYTNTPRFTPCFEETVLAWVPCIFLVVFLPFDIYFSINSREKNIPWNWRSKSKTIVCFINLLSSVLDFIYSSKEFFVGQNVYPVEFVSPAIRAFELSACLGLILFHRLRGVRSSGLLFLFWFLVVLTGLPRTSSIFRFMDETLGWHEVTFLVFYFSSVIIFALHFIADIEPLEHDYPKTSNPRPEISASFPSRLTFSWFASLALLGYRRPLVSSDLWNLNYEDTAAEVFPVFDKHWKATLAKNAGKLEATYNGKVDGVNFGGIGKNTVKPSSILPALWKTFWPSFVFGSILKLGQDLLGFVSPQVLALLIEFIQGDEPQWKGYLYVFLLMITAALQTLFLAQYFYKLMFIGMHTRTALISTIYRKALRLSSAARKESTVGEIVNIMSVDAQRFTDITTHLNMLWSAPLQISLALYFLWQILGPSVLAGLAVMIIIIPVNGFIANKMKTLQIKQMKNKDERIKIMSEILSGIKVLKLYAWEPSFNNKSSKSEIRKSK